MTTGRDSLGRFVAGNTISSNGGKARAAALSKRRRRQIAKLGWAALVEQRFGGNVQIAKNYMAKHARYYGDPYRNSQLSFGDPHPGTPEEFLAERLKVIGDYRNDIDFGWRKP